MDRWTALWALGAALLLAGGVLIFVPAVPDGPHTVTPPVLETQQRWYWVEQNVTGFTVTGSVPFTLDWSSSAELYLDYAICSKPQSNFSNFFTGGQSPVGCNEFYGLQGSAPQSNAWSVPPGGSVVLAWALLQLGPHNVSITYTIWTGLTTAGALLLALGSIFIVLGVIALMRAGKPETVETGAPPAPPP